MQRLLLLAVALSNSFSSCSAAEQAARRFLPYGEAPAADDVAGRELNPGRRWLMGHGGNLTPPQLSLPSMPLASSTTGGPASPALTASKGPAEARSVGLAPSTDIPSNSTDDDDPLSPSAEVCQRLPYARYVRIYSGDPVSLQVRCGLTASHAVESTCRSSLGPCSGTLSLQSALVAGSLLHISVPSCQRPPPCPLTTHLPTR
jgi:hypothetical protein